MPRLRVLQALFADALDLLSALPPAPPPAPLPPRRRLKYWVCFGVLTIADGALSFVLWWMPFYYLVKAGVVLYLMLDATRGAEVAYDFLVKPLLLKYQDFIDDSVVKATEAFTRAAGPEVEPELAPAADEWQAVEEMDNAVGDMAKED